VTEDLVFRHAAHMSYDPMAIAQSGWPLIVEMLERFVGARVPGVVVLDRERVPGRSDGERTTRQGERGE